MRRVYDPNFTDFLEFRCPECSARDSIRTLVRHAPECTKPETDYVFGQRIAQNIVIHSLENYEGEKAWKAGMPFTHEQLRLEFPDACARAKQALSLLIDEKKEKERLDGIRREILRLGGSKTMAGRVRGPKPETSKRVPSREEQRMNQKALEFVPEKKAPEQARGLARFSRSDFKTRSNSWWRNQGGKTGSD